MINYEDIFLDDIKDILSNKFSIKNDKSLFIYLYIRFLLLSQSYNKKIKTISINDNFINFIIKESCILTSNGKIIYKGIEFKKKYGFSNNIKNVIESWYFDISFTDLLLPTGENIEVCKYILNLYKKIKAESEKKSKKYKYLKEYKYFYYDIALNLLNEKFNIINVNEPKMHKNFFYDEKYYNECLPYEIVCKRMISCCDEDIYDISEKDVEDFLIRNIECIEEGLSFIKRQFSLKTSRIDILAKDRNNNYVIIELKVKSNDKRIIWQSIHYKSEFESMFNKKNVRVILLAPNYSESILKDLRQIKYVDIYKFNLCLNNKKITHIDVNRI